MNRARVLLVGTGRMGELRASLLRSNPRFDLCGIVDTNIEKAAALADKYMTKAFPSLSDAVNNLSTPSIENQTNLSISHAMSSILNEPYRNQLQTTLNYSTSTATPTATDQSTINSANSGYSPSIHGIVIATPTNTHAPLIEEAASKNISIFTEKPVDDTSDKISRLFSIADAHSVKLCCGFQRRFDDSYVSTQRTLADGHIGNPIMAHVTFADHPGPSMEFMKLGGCIYSDLSPHDVDYIRWCLGDDVESVYATGTSSVKELEDAGVHDNATMLLRFKRGESEIIL